MTSKTRQLRHTRCGRRTLPISKSSVRAGSISHHPRRLLALRHRLETLRQHVDEGITDTPDIALAASDCDSAKVLHKRRLLSDNGSSCIAADLADYLEDNGMKHVHGAPMHPQTQGKIERWHQTLKDRILLENTSSNVTWKPPPPSSSTTITSIATMRAYVT